MPSSDQPPLYVDSLWEEYAQVDIADVVVDIDVPGLEPTYSYAVPETLQNSLAIGHCVHLTFAGRDVLGYVIDRRALPAGDPLCGKLKPILGIVEDAVTISAEQIRLVRWMSEQYVCDLLSALRCVAPATLGAHVQVTTRLADPSYRGRDVGSSVPQAHLVETLRMLGGETELSTLKETANLPSFAGAYSALLKKGLMIETRTIARAHTVEKTVKAYTLGAAADVLSQGASSRRSPQQQRILNLLVIRAQQGEGPMPADELLRAAQAKAASLRGLAEKRLVQACELSVRRAPLVAPEQRTTPPELTMGQRRTAEALRACLETRRFHTVLLFGVTASGKTEVYLNAIARTLEQGRGAIVLLPEIALTAQVADVFVARFGEQVAVLHSKLSEGERHDEWRRMQSGEARIVVGARSAIFAPIVDPGLIVLDEEHEASYKQENTPRYNARELARERARRNGATLVLGSATPSLETYYASEEEQEASGVVRVEMPDRVGNRPLPRVRIVDLREEFKQRRALFSELLVDAMSDRLRKKQQIILFLNRRGYAQFVLCRDCGWTAKCPHCVVSLAFHAYDRSLKCHHCDYSGHAPQRCAECGGSRVKAFGIGTEKVEEEVMNLFPPIRVARMDRDTTARKGEHTRLVREFRRGEADILIGTQMVAKGLDFPNVTLVGVVSADTAINMPDFRAAERTFQLLTQVAGRAGRGTELGEVIVQTFTPDHYAIQAAVRHDYRTFYTKEILFRKELNYPPFSRFANLICSDPREPTAQARAAALAAALTQVVPNEIEIIGPSSAPLSRLKNQFRFHVALRAPVDAPLPELVRAALSRLSPNERLGVIVDIDPLSMA